MTALSPVVVQTLDVEFENVELPENCY